MAGGMDLDFMKRLARGLAEQFGSDCEVVVHDLTREDHDNTIVAIENGHISGRSLGDGPSRVALEAMQGGKAEDKLNYFTKTRDGRTLRSSTIFIKDDDEKPIGILAINYDPAKLIMAEQAIRSLLRGLETTKPIAAEDAIPTNVNDLLDQLIAQSVELVGKPVPMMNKDDKVRAIQFLSEAGAFLITRAGDKISKFFGISKYTMYTYFDAKEARDDG